MKAMGQNEKLLSDIDIVKINSVYGLSCKRQEKANAREGETKIKPVPDTSRSEEKSSSSSSEDSA